LKKITRRGKALKRKLKNLLLKKRVDVKEEKTAKKAAKKKRQR